MFSAEAMPGRKETQDRSTHTTSGHHGTSGRVDERQEPNRFWPPTHECSQTNGGADNREPESQPGLPPLQSQRVSRGAWGVRADVHCPQLEPADRVDSGSIGLRSTNGLALASCRGYSWFILVDYFGKMDTSTKINCLIATQGPTATACRRATQGATVLPISRLLITDY